MKRVLLANAAMLLVMSSAHANPFAGAHGNVLMSVRPVNANVRNGPAYGATASVSGNTSTSSLTLGGSDSGSGGYIQIGNGDGSQSGTGNISGNTTITSGTSVTLSNGTAPGSSAGIGNATGHGTVTGTVFGYTAPNGNTTSPINDPGTIGVISTLIPDPTTPTDTTITQIGITPIVPNDSGEYTGAVASGQPAPLEQLAGDLGGNLDSDDVTSEVGGSLNGKTIVISTTIIPGILTQYLTLTPANPHGVPPADEDYSSWGNNALWRY